jgi:hypothetical protein
MIPKPIKVPNDDLPLGYITNQTLITTSLSSNTYSLLYVFILVKGDFKSFLIYQFECIKNTKIL